MPTIPTPNAPVSYDQLVHLLKDDNKVKVAGESVPFGCGVLELILLCDRYRR